MSRSRVQYSFRALLTSSIYIDVSYFLRCYRYHKSRGYLYRPRTISPVDPETVRVLTMNSLGDVEYNEIALLSVEGRGRNASRIKITERLKEKAAEIGANAIIKPEFESYRRTRLNSVFIGSEEKGYTLAVRIFD